MTPKRILLTGGAGFIGSRVAIELEARGHKVDIVDTWDSRVHGDDTPPKELILKPVHRIPPYVLRDVEVVIHLAAQVGVEDSMEDPARYIQQNTLQTALFLQELRKFAPSLERIVVASSMSVYGEGGHLVSERKNVAPASVYGLSKYDQERLVLMWAREADIDACALRYFNVFGPGQSLDNPYTGVLANFSKRIMSGLPPIVYEDGLQTRDFIFVRDVAKATVDAALAPTLTSPVYNVSTATPTTIIQAAETLIEALGADLEPKVTGERRKGDIRHCTGDNWLIQEELGWRPQYSFAEGISAYADWLKAEIAA